MIKKIIVALFTVFIVGCSTNTPKVKSGVANDKITIYYIHREGCPACMYMDKILKNPEVKTIINNKFSLILVDINGQDILPNSSMVTGTTPTFYYLDSNNKEVAKPNHTLELDKFKAKLNSIR